MLAAGSFAEVERDLGGGGRGTNRAGSTRADRTGEPDRETATVPLPLDDTPYWILRDEQNRAALDAKVRPERAVPRRFDYRLPAKRGRQPLWDAFYKPLAALNFAVGGVRTSHVLWQLETGQVAQAAPKVVVLLIGSNNLGIAGQEPEEVAAGIEKIVDELGEQLPETRILLLGILPRSGHVRPVARQD